MNLVLSLGEIREFDDRSERDTDSLKKDGHRKAPTPKGVGAIITLQLEKTLILFFLQVGQNIA